MCDRVQYLALRDLLAEEGQELPHDLAAEVGGGGWGGVGWGREGGGRWRWGWGLGGGGGGGGGCSHSCERCLYQRLKCHLGGRWQEQWLQVGSGVRLVMHKGKRARCRVGETQCRAGQEVAAEAGGGDRNSQGRV